MLSARVEELAGKLPQIGFKWDSETEILAGQFKGAGKAQGLTGSVELAGHDGSFIVLDVVAGWVRGLEVVVWPEVTVTNGLTAPTCEKKAKLIVPSRQSQPGIAAVEVDTVITADKSPDEATIHLKVGPKRKTERVQIANNLLLEIDDSDEIAGFWLLNVPPFPKTDEAIE